MIWKVIHLSTVSTVYTKKESRTCVVLSFAVRILCTHTLSFSLKLFTRSHIFFTENCPSLLFYKTNPIFLHVEVHLKELLLIYPQNISVKLLQCFSILSSLFSWEICIIASETNRPAVYLAIEDREWLQETIKIQSTSYSKYHRHLCNKQMFITRTFPSIFL